MSQPMSGARQLQTFGATTPSAADAGEHFHPTEPRRSLILTKRWKKRPVLLLLFSDNMKNVPDQIGRGPRRFDYSWTDGYGRLITREGCAGFSRWMRNSLSATLSR